MLELLVNIPLLEFHVNVRRFDISSLPTDEVSLAAWLRERWLVKEKLLDNFSRTRTLGDSSVFSLLFEYSLCLTKA